MSDLYPYARGPLLEERNTYFYSRYGGAAFLAAWREERKPLFEAAASAAAPAPDTSRSWLDNGEVDVAALLEYLAATVAEGWDNDAHPLLDQLVQRFEVTKRIYDRLLPSWRAAPRATYQNLSLYLRFAEVAEAAYTASGRLPFLNVLFKVMDTLAAYRRGLGSEELGRLARLARRELLHVRTLAEAKGLTCAP